MRAIRAKDTRPEMLVRRLVHGMGYRYRLHQKDLPGKPDLVFPSRGKVIFVHGCFWHGHKSCKIAHAPKSNLEYWRPKLERNHARDLRNTAALEADGWQSCAIWECELADKECVRLRIQRFLGKV
jgi:DNA mismatch endonuclease (patch repair protein)